MIKAGTSDILFDTSSVDSLGAAFYIVGDAVPGIWTVSQCLHDYTINCSLIFSLSKLFIIQYND